MRPIRDRTFRSWTVCIMLIGVFVLCAGMLLHMAGYDWFLIAIGLAMIFALGILHPLLFRLGIVDGYYKYDADEIKALREFHEDIQG